MSVKVGKSITLAALLGVLLYVAVHFLASHGDAFEFAEHAIKNSRPLQAQIGKVERVRIPWFGSYKEKFFNTDAWAAMTVEVTGTAKTVELKMKMKKTNGTWVIEQASIDGNPVTLN
mgnify:CR=1 FL=1